MSTAPQLLPILNLNFKKSFEQLNQNEKAYTYYISKACWAGLPIVIFQISKESPGMFILFQNFFSSFKPFSTLKQQILEKSQNKITENDYIHFINFASKFYANTSNYSSFGHKKFIPEIPVETFETILQTSPTFNEIKDLWMKLKDIIYNDTEPYKTINLNDKGGKNSYYLGDITEEEINKIDDELNQKNIYHLNTRILKLEKDKYVVLVGSIDEKKEKITEDGSIEISYGEFASFLKDINENLSKAKEYAANDLEKQMLDFYIESFKTGSIDKHKDSQRAWIKNKLPVIEMNMGWVETYIDPKGVRGYYEGWVALTDKEKSKQFGTLVENAEGFLAGLPWSKDFEKDVFSSPDFIALDVVCFATDGCPIGINIPNYADVQETVGFKNISLANAYPSFTKKNIIFFNDNDSNIFNDYGHDGMTIMVACHELLGHGSGKLLRLQDGKYNFDIENTINPLTKEKITKYYKDTETYEQIFTSIGRSMEECRADMTGLYLGFNKKVHSIFGVKEENYENVVYAMWLIHFRKGILGLPLFNPINKKWGQAHTQGAWVFTHFIMENQKKGKEIIKVQITEDQNGEQSLNLVISKENILEYGQELVGQILLRLHIWKCTADSESAKEFYAHHSEVSEFFLRVRKITCDNEKPRRLELNHNLKLDENNNVVLVEYPETVEGIIESYVDRYGTSINQAIYDQWMKYGEIHF